MAAAIAAAESAVAADALRIGGLTPFSSIDWPGRLAAVVFVQGCPWRCTYCHNPHLQSRQAPPAMGWGGLRSWLRRRVGLLDAVVFSGGEPTVDPALGAAIAEVKALGFRVGLHSAGIYPRRLTEVLLELDWLGLDIKAPLHDEAAHARITGVPGSAAAVARCLAAARASGVDLECRTTAHPSLLSANDLIAIAEELCAAGVRHWALQVCRPTGCAGPLPPVPADYPALDTLLALRQRIPDLVLRRA